MDSPGALIKTSSDVKSRDGLHQEGAELRCCGLLFLVGRRVVCARERRYSWRPERALNPTELELQIIMFRHIDAGNGNSAQTLVRIALIYIRWVSTQL